MPSYHDDPAMDPGLRALKAASKNLEPSTEYK